MLDNLKRIREPLAWAVLGVVVLAIAISIVQVLVYANFEDAASYAYWAFAAQARWSFHLVVLVAAVWACWLAPAVPRAGLLAAAAAWVATLAVGLPLVALGFVAASSRVPPEFLPSALEILPDTALGILAVVALWALARREPEREDEVDAQEQAARPVELEPAADDDRPAPVWSRDDAAGTAWRTADEAAAGAPGSHSLATPDEPEAPPAPRT